MEFHHIILFFIIFMTIKGLYNMYIIKQLFVYDEKCVIYKKIIVDKIDDNNFFPISDITNFMNNNHKCFFHHFKKNSHQYKNENNYEYKHEIEFKCYC